MTLKLASTSVVHTIKFGKSSNLACSMKKFKVLGKLKESGTSIPLCEGVLSNDKYPEMFTMRFFTDKRTLLPLLFVTIVPVSTYDVVSKTVDIFHIQLHGISNAEEQLQSFRRYVEDRNLRIALSHLRRLERRDLYNAILEKLDDDANDEIMVKLTSLVLQKGSLNVEGILGLFITEMLTEHALLLPTRAVWTEINPQKEFTRPGKRGGHQMILDQVGRTLYLLMGWDGKKELGDLWRCNIEDMTWELLSSDVERDGGPSPRSCFKCCYSRRRGKMYLFGKYNLKGSGKCGADFYSYEVSTNKWERISADTEAEGGPKQVYDHSMLIDDMEEYIYVVGGRISTTTPTQTYISPFSGIFRYHIAGRKWTELVKDKDMRMKHVQHAFSFGIVSVMLDENNILMVEGLRNEKCKGALHSYNTRSGVLSKIADCYSLAPHAPPVMASYKITTDRSMREVYLCKGQSTGNVPDSFFILNLNSGSWVPIVMNSTDGAPSHRYGHDVVYDESTNTHYLFGGNPYTGNRLSDMWELKLIRPTAADVKLRIEILLKKQVFLELLSRGDKVGAVEFLQKDLIPPAMELGDGNKIVEFTQMLYSNERTGFMEEDTLNAARNVLLEQLGRFIPRLNDVTTYVMFPDI